MAFSTPTRQRTSELELERLLVGVHAKRVGQAKARTRKDSELTTEVDCPTLNAEFRRASGRGVRWTDAHTWAVVRELITETSSSSSEIAAARDLLCLDSETRHLPKPQRRESALRRLGFGDGPDSIRVRETGPNARQSAALNRILSELIRLIEGALDGHGLSSRFEELYSNDNSEEGRAWRSLHKILEQQVRVLDQPSNPLYPKHLTNRKLATHLPVWTYSSEDEDSPEITLKASGGRRIDLQSPLRRNAVLIGDPGSGKSTIAASIVAWHIEAHQRTAIFVRADALAIEVTRVSGRTARAVLVDAFESWLGMRLAGSVRALLDRELQTPDALIVIDGLDDVAEVSARSSVHTVLAELADDGPTVLTSTRSGGHDIVPTGWDEWTTRPLLIPAARKIFDLWFSVLDDVDARARAERFIDVAAELLSIPLMVGFVAILSSSGVPPAGEGELFDACIDLLLSRIWKPVGAQRQDDLVIAELRAELANLAWNLVDPLPDDRRDHRRWHWTSNPTAHQIVTAAPHADLARELIRTDGLLMPLRARDNDPALTTRRYRWIHRTLVEHLLASKLSSWYRTDRRGAERTAYAVALDPEGWSEVLRRTVGMLEASDQQRLLLMLLDRFSDRAEVFPAYMSLISIISSPSTAPQVRLAIEKRIARTGSIQALFDVSGTIRFQTRPGEKVWTAQEAVEMLRERAPFAHNERLGVNASVLREAYSRSEIGHVEWFIETFAVTDIDFALREAAAVVMREQRPLFLRQILPKNRPDDSTLRHLMDQIKVAAFPINYYLAEILQLTTRGRVLAAVPQGRGGDPMLLLAAFGWRPSSARRLRNVMSWDFISYAISNSAPGWVNGMAGSIAASPTMRRSHTPAAEASAILTYLHVQAEQDEAWDTLTFGTRASDHGRLGERSVVFHTEDAESVLGLAKSIGAQMMYSTSDDDDLSAYLNALENISPHLGVGLSPSAVVDPELIKVLLSRLAVNAALKLDWPRVIDAFGRHVAARGVRDTLRDFMIALRTRGITGLRFESHVMSEAPDAFAELLRRLPPGPSDVLIEYASPAPLRSEHLLQIADARRQPPWNEADKMRSVSNWFRDAGFLRFLDEAP